MELYVDNIARVRHAELKLEGITLVAGYNATGKSTISKSLYAVVSSAYRFSEKVRAQRLKTINRVIQDWLTKYDLQAGLKLLMRSTLRTSIRNLMLRPALLQEDFESRLEKILFRAKIELIPNGSMEELYQRYADNQNKNDRYYQNYVIQSVVNNIFSEQVNTLNADTKGIVDLSDGHMQTGFMVEKQKVIEFMHDKSMEEIKPIYITTSDLIDALGSRKGYRDSASLGYNSNANIELADYLLDELRLEDITAEEYHTIENQKEILDSILNRVVAGEMKVEDHRLIYYDDWCGENIELSNIASGMKLFVILKRLISNGVFLGKNLLMIDEPETNLHPDWQLKLAELLVLLYKKLNILIYVNSHSPYFVRAMEYFAAKYDVLEQCNFYSMEGDGDSGMFVAADVTMELGRIYDKLAEPFDRIM